MKTTLPSLKLTALDVFELHNHKKEIEVFSLRGVLKGKKKKKPVPDLEAEKPVELYKFKLSKNNKKKKSHFRIRHEAWPFSN